MSEVSNQLKPFLKWAGGKRWLASQHPYLLPHDFKNYHEPFLGSGAVFFRLRPTNRSLLSDTNNSLIACYRAVKSDAASVWKHLVAFKRQHSHDFYYSIRDKRYSSASREAARFIYLNRTCFNGIYRENLRGIFNVPKGTKDSVTFPDDDFAAISRALKSAKLRTADFDESIKLAKKGDFIFIDPPYTVRHNNNGFVKYNQKIFSWDDQVRLRDAVRSASSRGVLCLVTNANHPSIADLYQGVGKMIAVSRSSVIAGSPDYRGAYEELAIIVGYTVSASCLPKQPARYEGGTLNI